MKQCLMILLIVCLTTGSDEIYAQEHRERLKVIQGVEQETNIVVDEAQQKLHKGGYLKKGPTVHGAGEAPQQAEGYQNKINEMQVRIGQYQVETEELRSQISFLMEQLEEKNTRILEQDTMVSDLTSRLSQAEHLIQKAKLGEGIRPVVYHVRKGDSLWTIAKKKQIYGDGYLWLELYHGNKEKIDDPDVIYPGQVLVVPRY